MNFSEHLKELCRAERVPQTQGYFRAQDYICDQLQSFGLKVWKHEFSALPFGRSTNIIADTPTTTDQARVLIGAHYDSKASSGAAADDNASGVALLLELAARLPRDANFRFVFFDLEENFGFGALKGSNAFARDYAKDLSGVLIFDLIGGSLAPSFEDVYFQFGNFLPQLESKELKFFHFPMLFLEPIGKIFPRSDYHAFRNRGIPHTFISSGTPWYYHTKNDDLDIVREPKMKRLAESLILNLAKPPGLIHGSWDDLENFLSRLNQIPGFHRPRNFGRPKPSRLQMLQLYKKLLPYLRSEGRNLWS